MVNNQKLKAKITNFPYKDVHKCDAVVIMCMDFRFWKITNRFLRNNGIKAFDIVSFPGSAKMIVENNEKCPADVSAGISRRLHKSGDIIIVNHADCGAYGGRAAFKSAKEEQETHTRDVKESIKIMKEKWPECNVYGIYVNLIEDNNKVEFVLIK